MSSTHPIALYLQTSNVKVGELARAAKTTRQTIYRLMHGKQAPSMGLASRLSEATNGAITANDFMTGKSGQAA